MLRIGFIGAGTMAGAMIQGILNKQLFEAKDVYVYDPNKSKTEELMKQHHVTISDSNTELVKSVDIIIFAVEPHVIDSVICTIRDKVTSKQLIVSIAAGIKITRMESQFGKEVKIIRLMPNTAALINEGITAICYNDTITANDKVHAKNFVESFGKYIEIEEEQFDAFIPMCGSSPAFIYFFIDALAQSGINAGIDTQKSYESVAQAFIGAAKMVIETKERPLALMDKVCTKGGATIEGVKVLQERHVFDIIKEAALNTAKRSKEISKE